MRTWRDRDASSRYPCDERQEGGSGAGNPTWGGGQTMLDTLDVTGDPPNATVVLGASRARFLEILYAACGA